MTLKQCKSCFTMKNIRGNKIICKRCETEIDKQNKEIIDRFKKDQNNMEDFRKNKLPSISPRKMETKDDI